MNVNTNELRKLDNDEFINIPDNFTEVPKHLQHEAEELLNGEVSVKVLFDAKSSLAKWAKKLRENQDKGFNKEVKMAIIVKNQQKR